MTEQIKLHKQFSNEKDQIKQSLSSVAKTIDKSPYEAVKETIISVGGNPDTIDSTLENIKNMGESTVDNKPTDGGAKSGPKKKGGLPTGAIIGRTHL